MTIRAKTKYLFDGFPLTEKQEKNSKLNIEEGEKQSARLTSAPRRLVFELTNACNLRCMMCGRNNADFMPTMFSLDWLKKFDGVLDKVEEVALFGWGEPTVHPQFTEILAYLDKFPVRKYFCTNGMLLGKLIDAVFDYHVDIMAVSLDGANAATNNRIRCGGDFDKIVSALRKIVERKRKFGQNRPYINFVFCAMDSNFDELPDLVRLAADIGLEEVKVVYFTAFADELVKESLWGQKARIQEIFNKAEKAGDALGVKLKLPHLPSEDVAAEKSHKDCFVGWRDLFLGSDGYIRPCMSTPDKFFRIDDCNTFDEIWNHAKYMDFRQRVNNEENMPASCKNCYQSSHCNWNKRESFIQAGQNFAPKWEK